jgi:hypothetical protein
MHQKVKSKSKVLIPTPKQDCERADKEIADKEEDCTGGISSPGWGSVAVSCAMNQLLHPSEALTENVRSADCCPLTS